MEVRKTRYLGVLILLLYVYGLLHSTRQTCMRSSNYITIAVQPYCAL